MRVLGNKKIEDVILSYKRNVTSLHNALTLKKK